MFIPIWALVLVISFVIGIAILVLTAMDEGGMGPGPGCIFVPLGVIAILVLWLIYFIVY